MIYRRGNEPFRLKQWKLPTQVNGGATFYTCARPGRSDYTAHDISDDVVNDWVSGLPGPNTAIVSLLGRKRSESGRSEFSHYSFRSSLEPKDETEDRPTFQEWLDLNHPQLGIVVREHPTYDRKPVSDETLSLVIKDISNLISCGRTVVVVDSGGAERTGRVARCLGATEVTPHRYANS